MPSKPSVVIADGFSGSRARGAQYLLKVTPTLRKEFSRQHFYDILNESKPVSPSVAAHLGKLLGNGPLFWIRMQDAYDAWHAERDVDVSNVPTLTVA